jgi:hypothetical protein
VDPRAGLDDAEKRKFLILPGLELRLLGRPAHSQSLYGLRYPGSQNVKEGYFTDNIFRFFVIVLNAKILFSEIQSNVVRCKLASCFHPEDGDDMFLRIVG